MSVMLRLRESGLAFDYSECGLWAGSVGTVEKIVGNLICHWKSRKSRYFNKQHLTRSPGDL